MDSGDITNYDVLVEPPTPGKSEDYQLDKHKNHIGNNRLGVFLNLYRLPYESALQRDDFEECNKIVDKIFKTVSEQCVPRGRFLVSSSSANGDLSDTISWNAMEEASAKIFLRNVLLPAPKTKDEDEESEEQKRRQRSSLLRRSASETMVGVFSDSKKKISKAQTQEEPTTWKSQQNGSATPKRMDVILTKTGDALDPNSQSVGNNRLHVLVAMQSASYQQASLEDREAKVNEVITTVNTFWKGRFLKQIRDEYEELSKEEAKEAIRSIFNMRAGQRLSKRSSLPNPTLPLLRTATTMPLRFSLSAIPTSLPRLTSTGSESGGNPSSAATTVESGPTTAKTSEIDELRAAARDQLFKKKARQSRASRLEVKSRRVATPVVSERSSQIPQKRQSTILGKLDPSLMNKLVSEFDDADFNDDDSDENPDPPPPNSNDKF